MLVKGVSHSPEGSTVRVGIADHEFDVIGELLESNGNVERVDIRKYAVSRGETNPL